MEKNTEDEEVPLAEREKVEDEVFDTSDEKEDETQLPEVNELADENIKNGFAGE